VQQRVSVTVVIPHLDRAQLLSNLLQSLQNQTRRPDFIVVVDNGSKDGSQQIARNFGATVIQAPSNLGFAVAVNWGLTATNPDFVAVINNDVALDPAWLDRLLSDASLNATAGFFTGKILSAEHPDRLDGAFDFVTRGLLPWRAGQNRDAGLFSDSRSIQMASFTAILIRTNTLERIGLLDPLFESYLEDVDFGLRCARAGITGRYVAAAVCTHIGSATWGRWSQESTRLQARNQIYLLARHYSSKLIRRHWWAITVGQLFWLLAALKNGAGAAACRGKWQGYQGWKLARASSDPDFGHSIAKLVDQGEAQFGVAGPGTWLWRIYRWLT
jgi:GT2 family glycosyltransferase